MKTHKRKELKRTLERSNLKEKEIQKLFHENLEKLKKIDSNAMDTTEAYGLLLEKVNISAKEALIATKKTYVSETIISIESSQKSKE